MQGIYQITYRGAADWGMGMLVIKDGTVTGADMGGGLYDGTYTEVHDGVAVDITMTVPPGMRLVQGTPPKSQEYKIPFSLILSNQAVEKREPVLVDLPPGPVNVIFNRLRTL